MPGFVLAFSAVAVPAHADPETPPVTGGKSGDAPGRTGDAPPAPDHASAPDAVGPQGPPADVPQGPPADVPQGPPADVPQGPPADVPQGPPADVTPPPAEAAKGEQVVVCKYVRKPGVAEIFSHIIVVNENALLGNGFAGRFPFAFSDGQSGSVAIRYAEEGEQANEISTSVCSVDLPPAEEPPGEEPPGGVLPDEEAPGEGEVGGLIEEQDVAVAAAVAGTGDAILPRAGASSDLQLLALLGGLSGLAGAWLVARSQRAGRSSI